MDKQLKLGVWRYEEEMTKQEIEARSKFFADFAEHSVYLATGDASKAERTHDFVTWFACEIINDTVKYCIKTPPRQRNPPVGTNKAEEATHCIDDEVVDCCETQDQCAAVRRKHDGLTATPKVEEDRAAVKEYAKVWDNGWAKVDQRTAVPKSTTSLRRKG